MPKLWIVHRNPKQRASLARLSGLAESELVAGAANDEDFASASGPAAILLGLEGDFERELEFAHRNHARLSHARWLLICAPEDAREAKRLFRVTSPEILSSPATARALRAFIAAAVAHRSAATLAERQQRQRIAKRFSAWLGDIEVPGLLRALDPSLASLPLLVRGVHGSGRSLLCHYVEIFRNEPGPVLRLHSRDLREPEDILQRLRQSRESDQMPIHTIWIDEIDTLSVSAQNRLAEWITHGSSAGGTTVTGLRWIATAGVPDFEDRLEPSLEHAFAPLLIEVPALADHPETLAAFAEEVARDWMQSVGGVVREFADSALTMLEGHPWLGDRAELEAILRTSLAASGRELLEDVDLRFPSDPRDFESNSPVEIETIDSIRELTIDPEIPVVDIEVETTEVEDALESALFENISTSERAPLPDLGASSMPAVHPEPDETTMPSQAYFDLAGGGQTPAPPTPPTPPKPTTPTTSSKSPVAEPDHGWRRLPRSLAHPDLGASSMPTEDPLPDANMMLSEASFDLAAGRTPPKPTTPTAPTAPTTPSKIPAANPNHGWRRLARSLAHEIRNPLVSIRTFAELLPEHFDDETFRSRFSELVAKDVAHISDVLTRLSSIAERESSEAEPVDVSALIEGLLEDRRERIAHGRLLVLRELERDSPLAWADEHGLQVAIAGLLDRALESLPERGDLFVATRRIERSADGAPRLRILLRHHNPVGGGQSDGVLSELDPRSNILEYVLAETVVEASGGNLTIDTTDARETLILIDLRTPS